MKKCKQCNLKAIKVSNPMVYQCTICKTILKSEKIKKGKFLVTLDSDLVVKAKKVIKKYNSSDKKNNLNFSKMINNDLEKLTLDKLMNG